MDQTSPPVPPALGHAQIRVILIGIVLAMFLSALDQTIVATALPTIGRELHDVESLAWVVTAYLLTSTAVTPLYGKLSDIHGRRTMLQIAILVFLLGSVACALAPSIYILIVARALQGLGGGGLISLGQTIVGDVVAPRERGRYQAYFAGTFVVASVAGPILGGFFAEHFHWSLIFWVNLPLGVLAYLMTTRTLKLLPRHDRPHRLDYVGALLMVAATVAALLALSWGGTTFPWGSAPILGLLAASVIVWVLFAIRLSTAPEPFIPLSVLGNPVVRNGVIATFFGVGAMVGLTIYVPLYFEAVMKLSASTSGLALIVFAGGTVVGATLSGRVMTRVTHYKRTAVIGLAVATLLTLSLAIRPTAMPLALFEVILGFIGIGLGTIFPISTTSIQNAVAPHQMGTATGILNFSRSLGGAILVAVFGAVFLSIAVAGTSGASVQSIIADGAGLDFGPMFRGIFVAATVTLFLSFVFMLAMKELPLRGRAEADPPPPALE
jgi:EmrB/QacA subfamily drug resistance transporter